MCEQYSGINWELLVSTIIATGTAYLGFYQWRRELIGKKRAEIAEKAIVLSSQLRDTINWVRSPMSYRDEGKTRPLGAGESEDKRDSQKDEYYVKTERLLARRALYEELQDISYLFHAYFGDAAQQHFDTLFKTCNTIYSHVNLAISYSSKDPDRFPSNQRLLEKCEAVLYGGGEDDKITEEIASAVQGIESSCASIIRGIYSPPWCESIKIAIRDMLRQYYR